MHRMSDFSSQSPDPYPEMLTLMNLYSMWPGAYEIFFQALLVQMAPPYPDPVSFPPSTTVRTVPDIESSELDERDKQSTHAQADITEETKPFAPALRKFLESNFQDMPSIRSLDVFAAEEIKPIEGGGVKIFLSFLTLSNRLKLIINISRRESFLLFLTADSRIYLRTLQGLFLC